MGKLAFISIMVWLCGGFWAQAQAQEEPYDTLARIKESGEIRVGYRRAAPPFVYNNRRGQIVGYARFFSDRAVEAIRKELNMPRLKVKDVLITTENRFDRLRNHDYDFECGTTTNNSERQKLVSFSNTFFVAGTRLLVHRDSVITDFDDLFGRTVAVILSTTSAAMLEEMNARERLNMKILTSAEYTGAFALLENGEAEAFFLDDALLAGERAKAKNPDDWIIVGQPQSYEAYGCMFAKDDDRFKALIDRVVAEAELSGAALKAYNRWFRNPIPPNNMQLDFELSEAMKELFAAPNDRAYK